MYDLAPYCHAPRCRQPNFRYSESHAPGIGRDAPADVREVWQNAYERAHEYYKRERAPSPDNIARNTAWKTVKMFWDEPRKGQFRALNPNDGVLAGTYRNQPIYIGEPEPMPPPEKTATLCKLVELTWLAADGNLQVQRFGEPGLPDVFWNRHTNTLYVFPHVEMGAGECAVQEHGARRRAPGRGILANLAKMVGLTSRLSAPDDTFIGLEDQAKMYELWAKRPPTCRHELSVPDDPIVGYGVADTIVYRSDKWEDAPNPHPDKLGSQEYLHQFGLDVAIEETPNKRQQSPTAIVIRGGKLDVLEGGIAH